jgi:hypothetical protein
MGVAAESLEPLTSWTRTLNEDDALALLDSAHAGTSVIEWAERGDRLLPQASPERRRELIRIVREELLDSRDGVIIGSTWLRLLQEGSPHRRLGLLYGRLWRNRPLVLRALETLVHPALELADRPLAPPDADLVDGEAWDRFLLAVLRPGIPHDAFVKTRSTVQSALRDVGVLEISGNRERSIRVRRGRPDPLAYSWVLARELGELGEQTEPWALRDAFAARLFAPRPDYAATCVDAGVTAGLLRRGQLMAQSRLQVGPEMT